MSDHVTSLLNSFLTIRLIKVIELPIWALFICTLNPRFTALRFFQESLASMMHNLAGCINARHPAGASCTSQLNDAVIRPHLPPLFTHTVSSLAS